MDILSLLNPPDWPSIGIAKAKTERSLTCGGNWTAYDDKRLWKSALTTLWK